MRKDSIVKLHTQFNSMTNIWPDSVVKTNTVQILKQV